jgi:tRNA threonylcarbamoyl adenosine modification protein YeaZ
VLALAIDTSSAAVSAALAQVTADGETTVVSRRRVVDARAHAELLAPSIAACLAEAGVPVDALDAVVAGTGPGPFTGLRVGLMTAAAIADARDIPAYGVCSLDAMAPPTGAVLVAGDARRREVYWAAYLDGTRSRGPEVGRAGDVPTDGLTAMAGAGARLYADVLGLPLLEPDYPDLEAAVRLAAARILARAPGEPLTPLYLRRPDAVASAAYNPGASSVGPEPR